MLITAREISALLGGEIEGNPEIEVHSPSKIEEGTVGTITFLGNNKYEPYAYTTNASIILVGKEFTPSKKITSTLIRVEDVYASIGTLLEKFGSQGEEEHVIAENAVVHQSVKLHPAVSIGEYSVIEASVSIGEETKIYPHVFIDKHVIIGKSCIIYPGVKIYANTIIGDHCIIHAGSVLGSDGFGYSKDDQGRYTKISHVGNVVLKDFVEIGANTVIDRATMGSTIIEEGAKLDNLIQIAHNVEVGKHTVIAAQVGIAGSTKIGSKVMIGGQVGIAGHRKIADEVQIQGHSGVISNVKEVGKKLYGFPAIEYQEYLRVFALMRKLPEFKKRIEELEKKLTDLGEKGS